MSRDRQSAQLTPRLLRRLLCERARGALLHAGDHVGVGVSGGSDSVALLRLLHDLRDDLGIRLTILHFNHRLRAAESDGDERFVAALAAELGLPFGAAGEDVAAIARDRGWNLEDAGRRLRYAWFGSLLDAGTVTKVAVAHTADDQAETVLARLIRGTGPAGLAAIYPVVRLRAAGAAETPVDPAGELGDEAEEPEASESDARQECLLVRPLLGVRRADLRGYLESIGQSWREDPSNQDTSRLRAHLRHEILPRIERELQPGIVGHLGRLAEMAREDQAFWTQLVAERLARLSERAPDGRISIRCADVLGKEALGKEPDSGASIASTDACAALARRLVRGLVERLRGDTRELTAGHVEQVLRLAGAGSTGQRTDLPGVTVERGYDRLWFSLAAAGEAVPSAPEFAREIEIGSIGETLVVVPEICARFRLKVIDWPHRESENYGGCGVLDRDLLRSPLILRSWLPGDSYRPQGRQREQKLKQLLRVSRVARQYRFGWPVLTSEGDVVWARGLPVAAKFAPRQVTRSGVVIIEEP